MTFVVIYGEASESEILNLSISLKESTLTLLEFLKQFNIPIASSCLGEGLCKKCVIKINGRQELACNITMNQIANEHNNVTISIAYL